MRPTSITATLAVLLALPGTAAAESYVVQTGDSLGSISVARGVPIGELRELNHIDNVDHIEVGQTLTLPDAEGRVVEGGVIHVVKRGVTLRRIARAYDVPMSRLVDANRIRNPEMLRRGAEIFIPGASAVVPIATKRVEPCLRDPVEFYKVREDETLRVVIAQCNGRVWEEGQEALSSFLDRTKNHDAPALNGRLLTLVQKVSDHWSGRRIEVVSAYRQPLNEGQAGSRHAKAMALDFRVAGIPNSSLRDFARTLGEVGVGYYPNSIFVHLDVRETRAFWVDWSGPGETPRYGRLDHDPDDVVAERRDRNPRSFSDGAAPGSTDRTTTRYDLFDDESQAEDRVAPLPAPVIAPLTAAAP
jgi:uncharacterized protein YcbK (DUF882 family)